MKKQVFNPYLPSWEYVPDGEPYVYGDRLYVFGSHDEFNGKDFCQNDYVCWSAPVDDLSDWRLEGTIYKTIQDPDAKKNAFLQAPDVIQGPDGRFYLYYTLSLVPFMGVAVSDNLTGPYEYYGKVHLQNGHVIGSKKGEIFQFDPGVFKDDDGKYYLYSGFAPEEKGLGIILSKMYIMKGAFVMELAEDMLTVISKPRLIIPKAGYSNGTGFEGHEFYEASSMRKINGKYYFIYSSILSHELCYAVSDRPNGGFRYGGTLVSIGDVGYKGNNCAMNYLGNTHGSMVQVKGQWYVFYHRQTNRNLFSRQGCAEPITIEADGAIRQVEVTSCGLNGKPLEGKGEYSAHIACNLMSNTGTYTYKRTCRKNWAAHPYYTQTGNDRERDEDQYIANMKDGAVAGFKYFNFKDLEKLKVLISGEGQGEMWIRTSIGGPVVGRIPVQAGFKRTWNEAECKIADGTHALFFEYKGTGSVNFHKFELV